MEEALLDVLLYREFAQIDAHGYLPDESPSCVFATGWRATSWPIRSWHLQRSAEAANLLLKAGTAMHATVIAASSFTKNKNKKRDLR